MVRKKIDNRIRVLIENGVKLGHRTLFVIVGDKGRDQVCSPLLCGSITSLKSCFAGRYSTSHAVKSRGQSAPLRLVVLQERTGLQQPPQKANEAFAAQNPSGKTEHKRGRPVRTVPVVHENPLLLLFGNPQDIGQHLRHVRVARLRGNHPQFTGAYGRNGGRRGPGCDFAALC